MARLPYVDPQTCTPEIRQTLEQLPVQLNIFRMMAHAETNLRPLLRLGASILAEQKLDHRLREIAILQVARLSGAEYEWVQHVPIAKAVGATDEEVSALEHGDIEASCFDAQASTVLRFTTELVRDVRVEKATFDAIAELLSPREIVELILAVGFYMTMARLMEATEVDLDEAKGGALFNEIRRQR